MSHLDLPRLHFRGDFVADVFTGNNDDIATSIPSEQFIDSAKVTLDTFGMNDTTFSNWLKQIANPFGIRSGWNLFGTGSCFFENARIHGSQAIGGTLVDQATVDGIIGATVELNEAVMVDLDPEGTLGTQIFAGELSIRKSNNMRLVGRPSRMFSRFVTRRNLGVGGFTAFSASWYAAIPPNQLTILPDTSAALASFEQAKQNGKGLFMAFCIYLMAPRISQSQLASDFAAGLSTSNPAYGKVMGTVGTWTTDEMMTIPVGRRLVSATSLLHNHNTYELNPAIAKVDSMRRVVTVDLLNAFPETNNSLDKVNIGPVRLAAARTGPKGTVLTDIGGIQYDRTAYERQSGLMDVPYDASLDFVVQNQDFVLIQSDTDNIVMAEKQATIETDDRCIYLQEGNATNAKIRLHIRGALPTAAMSIEVRQFVTSNKTMSAATPTNSVVTVPSALAIGTTGVANLRIVATRPGTCLISLAPTGAFSSPFEAFLNVRVLPLDDYDSVPDSDLTFEFVYNEVLRYYHLVYPVMSQFVNLSDEAFVEASAQFIRDRVDPAMFENGAYMPVSRDMSDGKRKLLLRWLDIRESRIT